MSLLETVQNGTKLEILEAMRDDCAAKLDSNPSARDCATLHKRLLDILELLEAERERTTPDELDDILANL